MNEKNLRRTVNRRYANPIIVFLITMGLCIPALGQTITKRQLSRLHLSNGVRDQLVERFALFIEYEKMQSYDKQFELLAQAHFESLLHMKVTKESYVKFKQESQRAVGNLIGLKVKDIKKLSTNRGWFSLSVVATLETGKSTYSDTPICVGYLENGKWYFSLLYIN